MKSKIKRGKDFNGLCRYILRRSADPDLIGGNLAGSTAGELAQEFQQVAALRPEIERPVWHSSLALPKGEKLSNSQWNQIVNDYLQGLGFDVKNTPFVVVRHQNTESDHIHIAACRVNLNRSLYLGKNEHLIATQLTQKLELKHNLTVTPGPDHKSPAKALKTQEKAMKERTGKVPPRRQLQLAIDKIIKENNNLTVDGFIKELEKNGIIARQNLSKSGKMSGFSFEINGIAFKASQLGKNYGWQFLEKRLASTQKPQETPAKPVLPEPAKPAQEPVKEEKEEKVYQPRQPKPEAAAELAKTATATLADAVGDRDVAKVAGFIGDLFSGGIGLSSSKKQEYRQKAPDSKGLSPVKKPSALPSAPIRDKADRAEYQDNFNEIKKLNKELWASRRGKKRPGLLGKIIRWRMESVFYTKKIKELQKRNAEIKAKAEAQLLNPQKIQNTFAYNQIINDYCALAIKKDSQLQQLNQKLEAVNIKIENTKTQIQSTEERKSYLTEVMEENGWELNNPPHFLKFAERKNYAAWKAEYLNINNNLTKLESLQAAQEGETERLDNSIQAAQQEVLLKARKEIENKPQMLEFAAKSRKEAPTQETPAAKISRLEKEYQISKTRPDCENERLKRAEIRGEIRELCKQNGIKPPEFVQGKKKKKKERGSQGLSR